MVLRKCSNKGNWIAVKGKFLAARAVYPLQSWDGCVLNFCSVIDVALFLMEDAVLEDLVTIWAFCFRTSAGVRIKQETSSAVDEARA